MKVLVYAFIGSLILTSLSFAQEKKKKGRKGKKEEVKVKELPKRLYTEDEFQKAVVKEVEGHLLKLGKGKIVSFSKELLNKEQELKIKELEIQKEREKLKLNVAQFQKKIKEFQERQNKIISCIDKRKSDENNRMNHMVQSLSGMKPVIAAQVLSVQDPDISVKILGLLSPEKVSKIFNAMDKEVSARLQKQYLTMKK